jgi:hypothetical protein
MEETIKLWKELKISYAEFIFSCGGDSMNDTSMAFYDKKGNEIEGDTSELESYFDNKVYDRVEFYVNSDGHYQGESGTVRIELDEDGEDFTYDKSAESEWSESITSEAEVKLTKKMIDFVTKNILNINGADGNGIVVNYKRDFILNDEESELLEKLKDLISDTASTHEPELTGECEDGELEEESASFTTNEEGDEIQIKDGNLILQVTNRVLVTKPSED